MTVQGGDDLPDLEMERALAAVARPMARPAFREELRSRFCSGAASRETDAPIVPFSDAGDARRRRLLRYGGLLAAAGILAIGIIVFGSLGPHWRVARISAETVVKVDGRPVPVDDTAALARSLSRAKEIELEHGDLVMQIGDLALVEIDEGTRIALEGFDRRRAGLGYGARLQSGRLRAVTGPAFPGHRMKVSADLVDATVTGTAFGVDYEGSGDCVYCLDGDVEVSGSAIGSEPKHVSARRMCTVFRAGQTSPTWEAAPAAHEEPLRRLQDLAHEIWP